MDGRTTSAATWKSIVQARRLGMVSDIALAVVVLTLGVLRDLDRFPGIRDPDRVTAVPYLLDLPGALLIAAHVVGAALLLGRRRHPYVIGLALAVLAVAAPILAAIVMPYSVARHGRGLREVLLVNAALVAGLLSGGRLWHLVGTTDWRHGDPYSVILLASALTATGLYLRTRSELLADLADRAERAEREAVLLAEQSRLRERSRLAAELHDSVTHWVTLMTLQSGALSATSTDERVQRETDEVRRTGTRALQELQQLIRVLKTEEDETDPDPVGLAQLPASTDDAADLESLSEVVAARTVGRHIELGEQGDPTTVDPLLYEILLHAVSEALVNAGKHAPGAAVVVDVTYEDRGITATIVNDPSSSAIGSPSGSGLGLASIRRRCEAVGGQLDAAPTSTGGYRVALHLPRGTHVSSDGHTDDRAVRR